MKNIILQRLREPSTRAGLVVLLGLFGVEPVLGEAIGAAVAALGGLAAVLIPEGTGK